MLLSLLTESAMFYVCLFCCVIIVMIPAADSSKKNRFILTRAILFNRNLDILTYNSYNLRYIFGYFVLCVKTSEKRWKDSKLADAAIT